MEHSIASFTDDIIALKECKLMVNQALNCINGGTQAILDVLASDSHSCEALKPLHILLIY